MKSALRQDVEADLISSEAERRRFHPSLLGFHRATHDFIRFGSVDRFEPAKAFLREEGGTRSVTEGARVTLVLNKFYCNALSLSRPRQAAGASSLPEGASTICLRNG